MKTLYRYIREQRVLDPKELINEGRMQSMSDAEWLNSKYCNSLYHRGTYIQSIYDPQQNFALYGITSKEELDSFKETLKENKGINKFRQQKVRHSGYYILCFYYTPSKDQDRQKAIEDEKSKEAKAAEEFAQKVKEADTTKFGTNDKHINKMKAYFNKRSDPERLVKSIKDNDKLVARWIAAMKIDWPEAASVFGYEVENRKILDKAEIVAYTEKYKSDTEKVDTSDMVKLDAKTEKLATSWITKSVFKWMEKLPYEIEWVESFKNAKTVGGKEAMRRNGRAWSEGFIVKVTNPEGKSRTITFDIVTNEGGGLYGYCFDYEVISLKDFKKDFEELLK